VKPIEGDAWRTVDRVPGEFLVRVAVEKVSGATEMAGSPATS
jgi:hypothetical protein